MQTPSLDIWDWIVHRFKGQLVCWNLNGCWSTADLVQITLLQPFSLVCQHWLKMDQDNIIWTWLVLNAVVRCSTVGLCACVCVRVCACFFSILNIRVQSLRYKVTYRSQTTSIPYFSNLNQHIFSLLFCQQSFAALMKILSMPQPLGMEGLGSGKVRRSH